MNVSELDFSFPEELIALEPMPTFRTLLSEKEGLQEITKTQIFSLFRPGDVLVINDTRVSRRRLFTESGLEILFVKPTSDEEWEVLFPARGLSLGDKIPLPDGVELELVAKGLPQKVKARPSLTLDYLERHGELALPPYIQKARGERHMRAADAHWYQTAWAEKEGSCAAPTASLHFNRQDLEMLNSQGVIIAPLTLHVGPGTFLPVRSERLEDHRMHEELCFIPRTTQKEVLRAKESGARVWALGTTATRALESWGKGLLPATEQGDLSGPTDLFITPGFEFRFVDVLMTNFHQPRSTLLALVCAFAGPNRALEAYQWAVEKRFRLFSYGDFSIWMR